MATNDFKPFATGAGANVMTQADWEALPALLTGFQSGKASSAQVNKAIRQASFVAAALAQFISTKSGQNILDDGDLAGFVTKLTSGFAAQYLSRVNPFGDIKIDGAAAIAAALANLGLKTAAQRDVGTSANQIPDMSAFASLLTTNGYQKLPSGLIIQWGSVNIPTTGLGSIDVTYPIAYPASFLGVWGTYVTSDPSTRFVGIDGGASTNIKVRLTYNSPTLNTIRWIGIGF